MGLEVLIASRGEHSLISEVHRGLHIDLENLNSSLTHILKEEKKTPFAGVLGSDDSTVELAAKVADALGLPQNPQTAARLTQRKDLARAHLTQAGCPVPKYRLINIDIPLNKQIAGFPWPCVIKPLNLSASRGVIRANNTEEFVAACNRIKPIIAESNDEFAKHHILAEEYIDGIEVAFEGYLHDSELTTLVIFDKPDPLEGPYFEETIYVTPSQLDNTTQIRIKQNIAQACKAYGLTTGPVHAELRINEQNAWILEVACRTIGGDCARSLDNGSNFNLEELAISLAIGRPIKTRPPEDARGVMMIPIKQGGILRRVEGISAALKIANIKKIDIIIREGNELIPLPEGNQYPGYIFARGQSPTDVIHALREALSKLDFVVAPLFKLNKLN
ncbi:MAG: ATP-grasp domain-containing protein [Gammaproteobacteria bacterium]|nr:ATP-grasp domain-containing protein [Gammaproteobacteria bacterium]